MLNPIVFVQGAGVLKFHAVGRADDFFLPYRLIFACLSAWHWLLVTVLAPGILRRLADFLKICVTLY